MLTETQARTEITGATIGRDVEMNAVPTAYAAAQGWRRNDSRVLFPVGKDIKDRCRHIEHNTKRHLGSTPR